MTDLLRIDGPDGRTRVRVTAAPGFDSTGSLTASWTELDGNVLEFVVQLEPWAAPSEAQETPA